MRLGPRRLFAIVELVGAEFGVVTLTGAGVGTSPALIASSALLIASASSL
jgi:hypothetical protein